MSSTLPTTAGPDRRPPLPDPLSSGWPAGSAPGHGTPAAGAVTTAPWDAIFTPLATTDPYEISGYPIQARIGEGGMGAVYLSRTPGGRPLAVKVVRPEFATDPDFRARFAKEVAIAQRVQGPYTVPVIDADAAAARPWIATAYVPAPSLAIAVARTGALPAPSVLLLIAGIAEALESIHRAGVVHRDLKPGNVILAPDGPRVIDFGVARAIDAATAAMTQTGARLGTPAFMAPEQVQGRQLDQPGDVFALGATAYFALTGRPPFGVDAAVFHRIEHQQPDWDGCPDDLRDILARCMAKDPDARPTPAELITLCGSTSPVGRLTAGTGQHPDSGWLPPTVAAEITRYRLAPVPASHPPNGGPPEPPTYVPGAASVGPAGPTDAPRGGPHGPPGSPPGSYRGHGGTRRPSFLGAVGAVAFIVVCALAAILLTRSGAPSPSAPMEASAGAPGPAPATALPGPVDPNGGGTGAGAAAPGPAFPGTAPGQVALPLPGPGSVNAPGSGAGTAQNQPGAAPPATPAPASRTPSPAPRTSAAAPNPAATPSAAATSCPASPSHTYNGDGYGVLVEDTALRTGPYAACGTVSKLAKGLKVWLHCSVVNKHDNVWWWARLDGTSTAGWIYSGSLRLSYVDDSGDGRIRTYSCNGRYVDH
ncbi:protein kinase [Frankia sp. Cpl3]|nr:protein kinase [Frankia sp. Cpl3]